MFNMFIIRLSYTIKYEPASCVLRYCITVPDYITVPNYITVPDSAKPPSVKEHDLAVCKYWVVLNIIAWDL